MENINRRIDSGRLALLQQISRAKQEDHVPMQLDDIMLLGGSGLIESIADGGFQVSARGRRLLSQVQPGQ
jgi:hypothetical protein